MHWLLLVVCAAVCLPGSQCICNPEPDCESKELSDRCVYICQNTTFNIGQKYKCATFPGTPLSIDNNAENEQIKDFLKTSSVSSALIGYKHNGSGWFWFNEDPSVYSNLVVKPTTPPPTTTRPTRSTAAPVDQRAPAVVLFAIDASVNARPEDTLMMVEFSRRLAQKISDWALSGFAAFAHGCDFGTVTNNYNYDEYAFESKLNGVEEMIQTRCTQMNPTPLSKTWSDIQWYWYNKGYVTYLPAQNASYAVVTIFFSTYTDSATVSSLSKMPTRTNGTFFPITVGADAISMAAKAAPTDQQTLAIDDFSDLDSLVEKVYTAIYKVIDPSHVPSETFDNNYQEELEADKVSSELDSAESCSIINANDGTWNAVPCTDHYPILCQTIVDYKSDVNPTVPFASPCDDTISTSFDDLNNNKCYLASKSNISWTEATSQCYGTNHVFKQPPQLLTLESPLEQMKFSVAFQTEGSVLERPNQGMFWIGLFRDNSNAPWKWYNSTVDPAQFTNWRDSYPRDSEDSNCVAFVVNDETWVNLPCDTKLVSACSYHGVS